MPAAARSATARRTREADGLTAAGRFLRELEALTGARSPSSLGGRDRKPAPPSEPSPSSSSAAYQEGKGTGTGAGEGEGAADGGGGAELPAFCLGAYADALASAKREGRVLLVGLFSGEHDGDVLFKRSALPLTLISSRVVLDRKFRR